MKPLTRRQDEILAFIRQHGQTHGFPPSVRDIGERFGLSPATVHEHLGALERKGALTRHAGRSRSLVVAGESAAAPAETTALPVVGRVAAGSPILAEENVEELLPLPPHWARKGDFLLRVTGDSMRDAHILDGDYVLVRADVPAAEGDIVVALIEDEATVKRFHRTPAGIELRPENPAFEPIRIRAAEARQVRIAGKVTGVFRL